MSARTPAFLALAAAAWLIAGPALALDYSIDGFTVFRYLRAENLPISPAGLDTETDFGEMRTSLAPLVHLHEEVELGARVEVLSGEVLGERPGELDVLADLSGGDAGAPDDLESIEVDRLWLGYRSPVGLFRLGRQGNGWGTGVVANEGGGAIEWGLDGNGPDRGDTVDRASFVTDLARWLGTREDHLLATIAADKLREGSPLATGDDELQLVASLLYTNGTLRPRVRGTRELGLYGAYAWNEDVDASVGWLDLYGYLEAGTSDVHLYSTAEIAWVFGRTDRAGTLGSAGGDALRRLAGDSYASTLTGAGLDRPAADERAAAVAEAGSASGSERALLEPALAADLAAGGFAPEDAAAISSRITADGVRGLEHDEIDVDGWLGVLRAGVRLDFLHGFVEVGGSGELTDRDVDVPVVGPFSGDRVALVRRSIDEAVAARVLSAAALGDRSAGVGFDPDHDPALILFDQVGPIGPEGVPTVTNAFYVKAAAELDLTDDVGLFGQLIYGQLNRPVERFVVECGNVRECREELVAPVVSAGSADDLGVEIDAGATWHLNEVLTAELKLGYLVSGEALGPDPRNVFLIRPQVGASW